MPYSELDAPFLRGSPYRAKALFLRVVLPHVKTAERRRLCASFVTIRRRLQNTHFYSVPNRVTGYRFPGTAEASKHLKLDQRVSDYTPIATRLLHLKIQSPRRLRLLFTNSCRRKGALESDTQYELYSALRILDRPVLSSIRPQAVLLRSLRRNKMRRVCSFDNRQDCVEVYSFAPERHGGYVAKVSKSTRIMSEFWRPSATLVHNGWQFTEAEIRDSLIKHLVVVRPLIQLKRVTARSQRSNEPEVAPKGRQAIVEHRHRPQRISLAYNLRDVRRMEEDCRRLRLWAPMIVGRFAHLLPALLD